MSNKVKIWSQKHITNTSHGVERCLTWFYWQQTLQWRIHRGQSSESVLRLYSWSMSLKCLSWSKPTNLIKYDSKCNVTYPRASSCDLRSDLTSVFWYSLLVDHCTLWHSKVWSDICILGFPAGWSQHVVTLKDRNTLETGVLKFQLKSLSTHWNNKCLLYQSWYPVGTGDDEMVITVLSDTLLFFFFFNWTDKLYLWNEAQNLHFLIWETYTLITWLWTSLVPESYLLK